MSGCRTILAGILCMLILNAPLSTQPRKIEGRQRVNARDTASPQQDSNHDLDEPRRYIVVLNSAPISQTLKRIRSLSAARSSRQTRSSNTTTTREQLRLIRDHMESILDEQDLVVDTIHRNSWALEIEAPLRTILNGFIVKARPSSLRYIEGMPQVKAVYPSRPVQLALNSSVPAIGAPDVWNMVDGSGNPVTGQGITVGIIDSGIYYLHYDLGGCFGPGCKVAGGYDFANNDADPIDDLGHGTAIAGIAAANGTTKGVAKDATLFAYKVLDEYGSGELADLILALEAAADPDGNPLTNDHLDVVNISLGYESGGPTGELSREVDRHVMEAGIIIAKSAGNGGPDYDTITDPGYSESAITVGASNDLGDVESYSSRGYYSRIKPDVVAPGYNIFTLSLYGRNRSTSGTSMAAPHVAGAAALLKQLYPDSTPDQIKARLMNTSLIGGYDPFTEGAGRIRVDQAATVEMMFWPGSLMLGSVDYAHSTWSSFGEFELVNTSSNTRNYQLAIGALKGGNNSSGGQFDVDAAQYDAELSQSSVTLNPGESKQLSIEIMVHPSVLLPPGQLPYAYFSSITANDGIQEIRLPFVFIHAPHPLRQLDGWPVWGNEGAIPLIADLDNDGDLEVVNRFYDSIAAFHHDGTLLEGWPKSASLGNEEEIPAIGDLDGDGDLEIVFSSYSSLKALHHDGSDVAGWPVSLAGSGDHVLLANLDYDPLPEVVVSVDRRDIYAFDGSGVPLPGWPVTTNAEGEISTPPVAVDLDGDGDTEILKATGTNSSGTHYLYAFHHTGDSVVGWPVPYDDSAPLYGSPVAGDLDNDGDIEVVLTTGSGEVYAWHHNGTLVEGWPLKAATSIWSSPALADLDGDGDLEIVVTTRDEIAHAYHHDGTSVSGWPVITPEGDARSPVIGDIDGDGDQEIVFCSSVLSEGGDLNAYHHDGRVVDGFPLPNSYHFWGVPTLDDLDQDGDIEILVGSKDYPRAPGKLYAFDLMGFRDPANIAWGSWRHDLWGTSNFDHRIFSRPRATEDRLQRLGARQRTRAFR